MANYDLETARRNIELAKAGQFGYGDKAVNDAIIAKNQAVIDEIMGKGAKVYNDSPLNKAITSAWENVKSSGASVSSGVNVAKKSSGQGNTNALFEAQNALSQVKAGSMTKYIVAFFIFLLLIRR